MARDNFSKATMATLAKRVANRCSHPDCNIVTSGPHTDPHKSLNVGVAAHITAASPGGTRYDVSLSSAKRKSPENGIWLCQTHAKLIDNEEVRYSVDLLLQWKKEAESRAFAQFESTRPEAMHTTTYALLTARWNTRQIEVARLFFEGHCSGSEEEILGDYVLNRMKWLSSEVEDIAPKINREQLRSEFANQPAESRARELTDHERRVIVTGDLRSDSHSASRIRPMLLVADSGIGKTTFLHRCAFEIATTGTRIPILLTQLSRYFQSGRREDFVSEIVGRQCDWMEDSKVSRDWILSKIAMGEVVFLLDALDQTDAHWRNLDDVVAGIPSCPFILTTRPERSKTDAFGTVVWDHVELLPFNVNELKAYFGDLHLHSLGLQDDATALIEVPLLAHLAKQYLREKHDSNGASHLFFSDTRYQLFLRLICGESGLIDKGFNSLQRREPEVRKIFSRKSQAIDKLSQLAFWQVSKGHFETEISGDLFDEWTDGCNALFSNQDRELDIHAAITQLNVNTLNPILEPINAGIVWRHRSYLEFFAGMYVAKMSPTQLLETLGRACGNRTPIVNLSQWHWTLRFAIEHATGEERDDLALILISLGELDVIVQSSEQQVSFDEFILGLSRWLTNWNWLVYLMLSDCYPWKISDWCQPPSPSEAAVSLYHCSQRLSKLLGKKTSITEQLMNLSVRDIELVSSIRELLGDHHLYKTGNHAIDRWRGSQQFRRKHLIDEPVIRKFLSDERFISFSDGDWLSLADFPVTNEVVECFFPTYSRHRNSYSAHNDQPAIYLSPTAMDEFCEWLSDFDDTWAYRLPRDNEWLAFAGWGSQTEYWWGNEINRDLVWIEKKRCRGRQEAIEASKKVDIWHPSRGENNYGLLDILGNVWEICLGETFYTPSMFVFWGHGGSYFESSGSCRVRGREAFGPGKRPGTIGLRIVRTPKARRLTEWDRFCDD